MGGNIFGHVRSDMETPCGNCSSRHIGCRETCTDPQYLEAMRLRKLADEDRRKRRDADNYDIESALRKKRNKL